MFVPDSVIVPPVAAAAVIVMTLPFALLVSVLPDEIADEAGGEASGIFAISRGIGLLLGPVLGALATFAAADLLSSCYGYGAIFLVAAAAIAASAFVIRRLPESAAS